MNEKIAFDQFTKETISFKKMSNSSLSENVSLNNDPDTPPNPLTPPPSPLSLSEKPIARVEVADSDSSVNENATHNEIEIDNLDDQKVRALTALTSKLTQILTVFLFDTDY